MTPTPPRRCRPQSRFWRCGTAISQANATGNLGRWPGSFGRPHRECRLQRPPARSFNFRDRISIVIEQIGSFLVMGEERPYLLNDFQALVDFRHPTHKRVRGAKRSGGNSARGLALLSTRAAPLMPAMLAAANVLAGDVQLWPSRLRGGKSAQSANPWTHATSPFFPQAFKVGAHTIAAGREPFRRNAATLVHLLQPFWTLMCERQVPGHRFRHLPCVCL